MGSAAAGPASIASLGFSAVGAIMQGSATQSANEFQAARAEKAAQFGRAQADLTDTTMREQLTTTLGNIDAIRAAANIDPTSPTTAAVRDYNTMLSDRQRMAAVGSQRAQADEDIAGANYLRQAGRFAYTQGLVGAGAKIGGGLAQAYTRRAA